MLRFSIYLDCAFGAGNICISALGAKATFCGSLRQVNKRNHLRHSYLRHLSRALYPGSAQDGSTFRDLCTPEEDEEALNTELKEARYNRLMSVFKSEVIGRIASCGNVLAARPLVLHPNTRNKPTFQIFQTTMGGPNAQKNNHA